MTTIEKFAQYLGVDTNEFFPAEESTDKRVSDLETVIDILLSGEVNENG